MIKKELLSIFVQDIEQLFDFSLEACIRENSSSSKESRKFWKRRLDFFLILNFIQVGRMRPYWNWYLAIILFAFQQAFLRCLTFFRRVVWERRYFKPFLWRREWICLSIRVVCIILTRFLEPNIILTRLLWVESSVLFRGFVIYILLV